MLFNPFSLCYGRIEKEEAKHFNVLLSEPQNMNLNNNSKVQPTTHISEDTRMFLESRPKITKQLNLLNQDHNLKFNIRATGRCTRKHDQLERSVEGFNFKNGTSSSKLSNIPPLNLQGIDVIMERLNEIESLVKRFIDLYQALERDQTKHLNELVSEKVKEMLHPLLSSSSDNSLRSTKNTSMCSAEEGAGDPPALGYCGHQDLTSKDSIEEKNVDREFINCLEDSHSYEKVGCTTDKRIELDSIGDWTSIPTIDGVNDNFHVLAVEEGYENVAFNEVLELPAIKRDGDLRWGGSVDNNYPLEITDGTGDEIVPKSRSMPSVEFANDKYRSGPSVDFDDNYRSAPSVDFANNSTMSVSMKSLNTLSNLSELGSIE